ncbi:MAG: ABC transporter permease [Mycobacteriales bacterium]
MARGLGTFKVLPASLRTYGALAAAQLRSQTKYRASFAIDLLFSSVLMLLDTLVVLVLFRVTPKLGGFDFGEVLLIASLAGLSFSLADLTIGNIDQLPRYVRQGLLDIALVRPMAALGQLVVGDISFRRLGRVAQSVGLLAVAIPIAHVHLRPATALLLPVAALAGAVTFGAIFVTGASMMFWLVEASEVANAFTYGGRDFTLYPTTVYSGWFRRVFAYGLGFAAVVYLPALAVLGRIDPLGSPPWLRWLSPGVALPWCLVALGSWRTGVRRYGGTGS